MRKEFLYRKRRIKAYLLLLKRRRKADNFGSVRKQNHIKPAWFREMWEEFQAFSSFSF